MGRTNRTYRAVAALAASLLLGACTVHKQDTPSLSGPSALGTSLVLTVSPDQLQQDGASQSLVQINAYDNNGQPLRNVSMHVEISVDGAITDFGSLSARNVVTDANGRASVVYTAPASPPPGSIFTDTVVQIMVTPAASDFADATARRVNIRLTAPGVIGPGLSPLRPDFTVPAATIGNSTVFQATVVDATGADATGQVVSYAWTFGDGGTASGRNVTHTYTSPGTFPVSLTITDNLGRTQRVTHTVTTGQGQLPTATFVISPSSPVVIDQTVNFNASGSTAEPGHTIANYDWTFGDGTQGGGAITQHRYHDAGNYTVTLQVTDDAGRKSALISQSITVSPGNPSADITVSPPSGPVSTTFSFIGSQSTPAAGRTIVKYDWNFGDNTSGSGPTTSHRYGTPGTYTVTLIVTDDKGNQGIATATVTVTGP